MQYPRVIQKKLALPISQGKVRLVLGARQTGKSTLFKMLMDKTCFLIDLQERSERTRFSRDPALLGRRLKALSKECKHVLIDEVQKVPALLDEIQIIADKSPRRFTFTLTGSSARKIRKGSANTLPGRAHLFHISPITLWEQNINKKSIILSFDNKEKQKFPRCSLEKLLIRGCLPAAWTEKESFIPTLETYAELYLEEEVQREALVRSIGGFGNFLQLAAIESGKNVNLTKISQESGIAISTLQGFFPILADTFTGFFLPPFSKSKRIRIRKTPKFYFFDIGVRNAVARIPLDQRILASHGGYLFEHFLACELMARIKYLGRSYQLSYWRTTGGAEVDFILETPNEIIPIEAKYTKNPRPQDASGIEHFIKLYPRVKRGFVICRIKDPEQISMHVTAIPWDQV